MARYDYRRDRLYRGMEAPTPRQGRRFEPSTEDRAWAAEVSARGGFLPPLKGPGLTPPARKRRAKWGDDAT